MLFFMLVAMSSVLTVLRLQQKYEMILWSDSFQAVLCHLLLLSQGVLALQLTNQLAAASSLYANEYHLPSQGDEAMSKR